MAWGRDSTDTSVTLRGGFALGQSAPAKGWTGIFFQVLELWVGVGEWVEGGVRGWVLEKCGWVCLGPETLGDCSLGQRCFSDHQKSFENFLCGNLPKKKRQKFAVQSTVRNIFTFWMGSRVTPPPPSVPWQVGE